MKFKQQRAADVYITFSVPHGVIEWGDESDKGVTNAAVHAACPKENTSIVVAVVVCCQRILKPRGVTKWNNRIVQVGAIHFWKKLARLCGQGIRGTHEEYHHGKHISLRTQ